MQGYENKYVLFPAPAIPGYKAVGAIEFGHNDVANVSIVKWAMSGSSLQVMVKNETSGERTPTFSVTLLYLRQSA